MHQNNVRYTVRIETDGHTYTWRRWRPLRLADYCASLGGLIRRGEIHVHVDPEPAR